MTPDNRTIEQLEDSIQQKLDAILRMLPEEQYPDWFVEVFGKYWDSNQ